MRACIVFAALNGLIAVAAGAFAAHALQATLEPKALAWVETAARYEMWHALAMLGAAALGRRALCAAWAFGIGIVLFSGSLYLLAATGLRPVAWITPFGGVSFLVGWALLAGAGWRQAALAP